MFLDSCVRQIYPYRTVSEATAIPDKIFPVYIGSGSIIAGIDVTGMQGLNNIVQDSFGGSPEAGDLFVVGQGLVGETFNPNNTIPFGWLDYDLIIDGKRYTTAELLKFGANFKRDNDIYRGIVKTSYILDKKVCIEITAFAPLGTKSLVLEVRMRSYNPWVYHADARHNVQIEIRFNMTKRRNSESIFDSVKADLNNAKIDLSIQGHELYKKTLFFKGDAQWSYNDNILKGLADVNANPEWSEPVCLAFSVDEELKNLEASKEKHLRDWEIYYAYCGDIKTGNVDEEFVFHNSLYLLKLGYDEVSGYPIGHPFFCPGCWNQCMFWDMHFVFNGLIKTNHLKEAERIMRLLSKVLRKEGKPFPWMFIYDGTTFLDDSRDIAPVVIAAHAMTAINCYETLPERETLKNLVWPILKRCCDYATSEMFGKNEKGKWIVSLGVSNDVVEEEGTEINQTYTTLWFLVLLKKAIEYAQILEEKVDPLWQDILSNYWIEQENGEYLHCKNKSAEKFNWASWIPFLAYPTEGMPLLDENILRQTRKKYSYRYLYKVKQNCFQPWTELTEAEAAHRSGEVEVSYDMVCYALRYVFGDGYFCEVAPQQQTCGYPPYITAHGQYLSTLSDMFLSSSVWEKNIKIGCFLPYSWADRDVSAMRLRANKGVFAEKITFSKNSASAYLSGNLKGFKVEMRVPIDLVEGDIRVFINGVEQRFDYEWRRRSVSFILTDSNFYKIEIR